jgi:hypothetical protein
MILNREGKAPGTSRANASAASIMNGRGVFSIAPILLTTTIGTEIDEASEVFSLLASREYLRPSFGLAPFCKCERSILALIVDPPATPPTPRKFLADCPNYVHIFAKSGRFLVVTAQMLLRSHIFAVQRNCFHTRPLLSLSCGSGGRQSSCRFMEGCLGAVSLPGGERGKTT